MCPNSGSTYNERKGTALEPGLMLLKSGPKDQRVNGHFSKTRREMCTRTST